MSKERQANPAGAVRILRLYAAALRAHASDTDNADEPALLHSAAKADQHADTIETTIDPLDRRNT